MTSQAKKITLLFGAVIVIGMIFTAITFMNFRPLDSALEQTTATPRAKTLGTFRAIDGTDFLISSVTGSPDESSFYEELFSSGRWYGGGSGYNQYNIVFLDTTTETVYPLLPTNDYEIISLEGFPKPVPVFDQTETAPPKVPIAWWLFSIVKADTNQDKDFSLLDKQTLSIADVGGRGYTEIIPDLDNILATVYKENNTLLVIYRSNQKIYLAHVDLPSRQVSSTEELELGAEIK